MPDNAKLVREKVDQAVAILNEQNIDAWMTFARETSLTPDPSLDLILGMDMVWQSAFIITRSGQRVALIGQHDADNVKQTGAYNRIIPYMQGVREALVGTLLDLNPQTLALNYSEDDVAADGLSHGLMLMLQHYLGDTDLVQRFVSSERIVGALRGRKSASEVKRVKAAIAKTQEIFKEVGAFIAPGHSEVDIADHAHARLAEQGLGTAWDSAYCPIVNVGPASSAGHGGPQARHKVKPGMLIHIDMGVKLDGYCADLQRMWHVRQRPGEALPASVSKAFRAARGALLAGYKALKPGVEGWQVDDAARSALVAAGYPEYQHAFGHQLGRMAHDGGAILGPRWERYGKTPFGVVEAGNIYAIELDVDVPGYGTLGLEENVVVTDKGAKWLSDPQTEVWQIG